MRDVVETGLVNTLLKDTMIHMTADTAIITELHTLEVKFVSLSS